ncbi:MAG: hypothetical protein HQL52_18295 [Magnetococcales bacterium]|nr:hypothetical protein [Magnetococcales bacterium]
MAENRGLHPILDGIQSKLDAIEQRQWHHTRQMRSLDEHLIQAGEISPPTPGHSSADLTLSACVRLIKARFQTS